MEISPEVRERIERNRQAALLRKQQRIAESSTADSTSNSVQANDSSGDQFCSVCGIKQRHEPYFTHFQERVCNSCIKNNDEFALISQGDAKSNYLLTSSAINTMPFIEQMNPKHAQWTTMKLYLKKHVIAKCLKRWNTLEELAEEKSKREARKFERDLQDVEEKINPASRTQRPTSKKASKKRKFNESLAEMVATIKGVPYTPNS